MITRFFAPVTKSEHEANYSFQILAAKTPKKSLILVRSVSKEFENFILAFFKRHFALGSR
jgi:hypothetical protein